MGYGSNDRNDGKVVNEGTGTLLKTSAYQVAGKTGSAEADSDGTTHAWFVGFAPSNHPKLVVSIVVEGAGTGGKYAVPIAKRCFGSTFRNNG